MNSTESIYDVSVGIEDSNGLNDLSDHKPFDPQKISLSSKSLTMDTIIRRFVQGTIKLNPDFQRAEIWNETTKSRLIESLALRIPIPMLYLSTDYKNKYTVIDGLQRLSAIRDYVIGKKYLESAKNGYVNADYLGKGLKLQGLEFLSDYNGKCVADLPTEYFNRIMETEFSATIIEPRTPEDVKRNIFKRINTGGMRLSNQEIRNALYSGPATELLKSLTSEDLFIKATDKSIQSKRAEDQELILRLISFFVRPPQEYRFNDMESWLSVTMQIINASQGQISREISSLTDNGSLNNTTIFNCSATRITEQFKLAMCRSIKLFGKKAFRKSSSHSNRRTAIAKPLFETWGYLLAKLTETEFQSILRNKKDLLIEYSELFQDKDFLLQIGKNSSKANDLPKRFSRIHTLIQRYI